MECYLSPTGTGLRFAIKCVCFGAVLLWIVCGFYMSDESEGGVYGMRDATRAHYRRLLAVSSDAQVYMDEDEGGLGNGSHFAADAEVVN